MAQCVAAKLAISVSTLIFCAQLASSAAAQAYAVSPGDSLTVRVVLWDEERLAFIPWDAVSGDYTVSAEGQFQMPLVGDVTASGRTVSELSRDLGERLQVIVKSFEPPSVAVAVSGYSPFYVLGDVENPGSYPAKPGITVYQAFALAGGAPTLTDISDIGMLRGVVRDSGELAQARRDIVRNSIRVARLTAELAGAETFEQPDGLTHPDGPEALSQMIAEERAVFAARKTARSLEGANLEDLKLLLSTEVSSLNAKRERLVEQIGLAAKTLENMQSLRASGLAREVQMRDAQRVFFELESQDIDLQNGIFRAQQRIKEADRDILGLETRLATENTRELQTINAAQEDLLVRREMLASLVELAGVQTPSERRNLVTSFYLTRQGQDTVERPVAPDTRVMAGDILRIERVMVDPQN